MTMAELEEYVRTQRSSAAIAPSLDLRDVTPR